MGPIVWKHDVIQKPEIHNVSQRRYRRTKPGPQATCTKIWWSLAVWFLRYVNGQRYKQILIIMRPYFTSLLGEGEIETTLQLINNVNKSQTFFIQLSPHWGRLLYTLFIWDNYGSSVFDVRSINRHFAWRVTQQFEIAQTSDSQNVIMELLCG